MSRPLLQAWCSSCEEMVMPADDGRCVWCDTQTGADERERIERTPYPRPVVGDPAYGPECPECGGRKSRQSWLCAACRRKGRWRGGDREPRRSAAGAIPDEVLLEAKRLYATGLSLQEVADVLWPRTTSRSPKALSAALRAAFERRGWRRRDRGEQFALRASRPKGVGRPRCAGRRRSGGECRFPAREGSRFCWHHDPANAEIRRERFERNVLSRKAAA